MNAALSSHENAADLPSARSVCSTLRKALSNTNHYKSLTGTLKGEVFAGSMELALSDVLVPEILLLRGDLSAGTSAEGKKKKKTGHEKKIHSAARTRKTTSRAIIASILLFKHSG